MDHKFIQDRDIVMFSFQPWDTELGSNFKDMALELAKKNRILFVNRALDRRSRLRDRNDPKVVTRLNSIKNGEGELQKISRNIWVHNPRTIVESINWIPFAQVHDALNRINNRRLANEISKAVRTLKFKNILLINDNDFTRGFYLKEMLNCKEYIFYIRDYMLAVDFFKRHGARLESGIMRKADVVVANSSYLAEYSKQFNKNSFNIGQGCDLRSFLVSNLPQPGEMRFINRPVIGYAGFISEVRLHEQILLHIAKTFSNCSVVLVGPVDDFFKRSQLNELENVYFLGRKDPAELPAYIQHFDVCINPQVRNSVTIGNYPRKVDEYLAMGKPVVATATKAMEMFAPYTFLCEDAEDYVKHIHNILQKPEQFNSLVHQKARTEFALTHTWNNCIGLLGDAIYNSRRRAVNGGRYRWK